MSKKPIGGRRAGSGRPPKPPEERHVRMYFSLPPDVAAWILALDRRGEWLTEVVRQITSHTSSHTPPDAPAAGDADTAAGRGKLPPPEPEC